jgi:hypothetical protein
VALIAPGLFVLSFLLLWVFIDPSAVGLLDEGLIVYGAERVMQGDRPYRDFWALYGPGSFWTLAALFKIFGPSLLVERLLDTGVKALLATFAYLLTARLGNRAMGLVAWGMCLGWAWALGFPSYPVWTGTMLALAATFFAAWGEGKPHRHWTLAAAGFATALAAMYRHDMGACIFVSVSALIFLGQETVAVRARHWAIFAAVTVIAFLPTALYLLIAIPFNDLVQPLYVYPTKIYARMRGLPYPRLYDFLVRLTDTSLLTSGKASDVGRWAMMISGWWAYFFPFFAGVVVAASLLLSRRVAGSVSVSTARAATLSLVILMGLLLAIGRVRPFPVQLLHVYTLAIVVGCIGLAQLGRLRHWAAAGLLTAGVATMALYPIAGAALRSPASFEGEVVATGRGSGFVIYEDQAEAVHFVKSHVREDEPIFVGCGRHDIIFGSDVLFYFLAQRRSATKYHEFQPGLITTAAVQTEIIGELTRQKLPYVVIFSGYDHLREPNESRFSSGVRLLDDYLAANYAQVRQFGRYSVRKRL